MKILSKLGKVAQILAVRCGYVDDGDMPKIVTLKCSDFGISTVSGVSVIFGIAQVLLAMSRQLTVIPCASNDDRRNARKTSKIFILKNLGLASLKV